MLPACSRLPSPSLSRSFLTSAISLQSMQVITSTLPLLQQPTPEKNRNYHRSLSLHSKLFQQLHNPALKLKVSALSNGSVRNAADLKCGHVLYWSKALPSSRGEYLFKNGAAKAFREMHETAMQAIEVREVEIMAAERALASSK